MNEKSQVPACSRCGVELAPDALRGLCPRCLMELNLMAPTEVPGETASPGASSARPLLSLEEVARHFPQFQILECLGRGGMGVVYKARQPKLNRLVALKILAPEKVAEPKFAERFEREAQALARLNHPNIVTVYDFGETGGLFFLTMEFVDGVSLRQLIQAGKMVAEQALTIVPRICEALQYAHDEGVVHRDIKPENLLLDKKGRVKIADFGIAKIMAGSLPSPSLAPAGGPNESARTGEERLTQDQVLGTPNYMAPEQVEKPEKVDHRADIYSLGVVFYELLTGELPLGKFQPPSKKVHVDVRLDEVVLHTLEKEPELRYQQASQVKTAVETIAQTNRDQLQGGNAPAEATGPFGEALKRVGWRLVLLLVGYLALLAVLNQSSLRWRDSTRELWSMALIAGSLAALVWVFWPGFRLRRSWPFWAGGAVAACFLLLVGANVSNWVPRPNLALYQDYIQQQLQQANAGNYWAKYNLWEAYSRGRHGVASNPAEAARLLPDLVKGVYLARFEPANGFRPASAEEMLAKLEEYGQLYSGHDEIGGAGFLRTRRQGDKLIGSFLTSSPDQFKAALQRNPHLKLISIEPLTPKLFLAHEAAPQESLQGAAKHTVASRREVVPADVAYPAQAVVELGGGIKMEFVLIRRGSFMMGSNFADEGPSHRVTLTKPFYLGKYEVSQEQWNALMETNRSHAIGPKLPVANVRWEDAQSFLKKLGQKTGRKFALPTEAQWEYACRAGTTTTYSSGDGEADLEEYAWFAANADGTPHPVGEKKPNAWGLYDMHGNVWERCADGFAPYRYGPATDPKRSSSDGLHVIRGGAWTSEANGLRCSNRNSDSRGVAHAGLRCVMLVGEANSTISARNAAGPHRKFVRLVVEEAAITFEGQPTTWEGVGALMEKVAGRTNTVLEFAVTSDRITVQQQNEWFGKCVALAKSHGFEYASFIGIKPLRSKGTPGTDSEIRADIDNDLPLAEGVRRANEQYPDAQPLTEEEVIAAVRELKQKYPKIPDAAYRVYQRIPKERVLPRGMYFSHISTWIQDKGYFNVDWKDLTLDFERADIWGFEPGTIFVYRIRARFVSSHVGAEEAQAMPAGTKATAEASSSSNTLTRATGR